MNPAKLEAFTDDDLVLIEALVGFAVDRLLTERPPCIHVLRAMECRWKLVAVSQQRKKAAAKRLRVAAPPAEKQAA